MKFLNYLDSKRLNECIIFAKHSHFNFCKYETNKELIRHYNEFEIEQTLFLSFCKYDVVNRVKEYMTEENKNLGYNFSLTMNSLNSAEFLDGQDAIKYEELSDSNIREIVKLWFENKDECEIRFGPIEYWNTSRITNMSSLFFKKSDFNSDISRWNVSKVTNMMFMFYKATSFNSDISNWNVSNVTNMNAMFFEAISFNSDISNWNISNVTDIQNMFKNPCSFNSNLLKWNVNNACIMFLMLLILIHIFRIGMMVM